MLARFLQGFKKVLKGEKGYTLVEVAAVIAVTATLAAVVIPVALDKIDSGREATAKSDVQALASAVAGFFADTAEWPAQSANTSNYLYSLRTGNTTVALFATNTGDPAVGSWGDSSTAGYTDIANDHLVVNEPFDQTTNVYSNWGGPYTDSLLTKKDPWDHNYIIWVKGMHTTGTFGWIISGGPDGTLDTVANTAELTGDDIGIVLYAK